MCPPRLKHSARFYFSASSRWMPLLIASTRVIPCFLQYSINFCSVSSSNRTENITDLGLSTFGLPICGVRIITSLSETQYILCVSKSQPLFGKFLFSNQKAPAHAGACFNLRYFPYNFYGHCQQIFPFGEVIGIAGKRLACPVSHGVLFLFIRVKA